MEKSIGLKRVKVADTQTFYLSMLCNYDSPPLSSPNPIPLPSYKKPSTAKER